MRVLWFTSVMPPAVTMHLGMPGDEGPATWIESLRSTLVDRDAIRLAIASPCSSRYAPFDEGGVLYYSLPSAAAQTRIGEAISGWRSSMALPDISEAWLQVVRDFDPHIIHIHGTENPFGLISPRVAVPVVISLQGLLTVYERFYFHGMTPPEVLRLAFQRDFVLGRSPIQGYWRCTRMAERERQIVRSNRVFIGRTAWDKAVLRLLNPSAIYYHCDEMLRAPFYAAEWQQERADSRTVFCTSSTLLPKRAESLIEALALLHDAGHTDVRLRIAGIPDGGPDDRFHQTRARKYGIARYVESLGRIGAEQLVTELLGAAVFAYPSHTDNSPNALCEALLVGVPTVASYVGGVPSLMEDGRDGLLFPDGDAHALAGRILHLLNNPSDAAELARKARVRALRRHDPDTIVGTLLRIYGELVP